MENSTLAARLIVTIFFVWLCFWMEPANWQRFSNLMILLYVLDLKWKD